MPGSEREWRQRRGSRIFIKITSCEACDEGSVHAERHTESVCQVLR